MVEREIVILEVRDSNSLVPPKVSKGISAHKTKTGRWRFEIVDKKDWEIPEAKKGLPIGLFRRI